MTDSTRPAAESTETTATNTIPSSNQRERVSVNPEARTRLKEKQVAIPSEGHALSTGNTASQFAISFSCLLKMVDELILQFSYINRQQLCLEDAGAKRISQFLNLDPGSLRHYLNVIELNLFLLQIRSEKTKLFTDLELPANTYLGMVCTSDG